MWRLPLSSLICIFIWTKVTNQSAIRRYATKVVIALHLSLVCEKLFSVQGWCAWMIMWSVASMIKCKFKLISCAYVSNSFLVHHLNFESRLTWFIIQFHNQSNILAVVTAFLFHFILKSSIAKFQVPNLSDRVETQLF